MNKREIALCIAIALLYAAIIYVTAANYWFDDIGFDFAGYAMRYIFAFDGWIKNVLMGVPASTYDGFLPAVLPALVRLIGAGTFTLPLAVSLLLLRLAVPLAFIPLGKMFGIKRKESVLIGLVFVANPITFKFFNRYYEFFGWLFFVLAFVSFYKLMQGNEIKKRHLLLSSVFTAAIAISHSAPLMFFAIASLFLVRSWRDLKKLFATALLSIGLSAFWLLPLIWFWDYSMIAQQQGSELITLGITASSVFLAVLLAVALLFLRKARERHARVFQFTTLALALAVVQLLFPNLPIINKPFIHSYHVFYIFVLLIAFAVLWKERVLHRNHFIAVGAVCVAALLLLGPVVQRQYFGQEPRLSAKDFGENVSLQDIEALLRQIPKDTRFETLPYVPIVSSVSSTRHDLSSLIGYGYNVYANKDSWALGWEMVSMELSCEEFGSAIERTATAYWISLSADAEDYLRGCGLEQTAASGNAGLFKYGKPVSLVENGELLLYENNLIKARMSAGNGTVKINYLPRWRGFAEGKELQLSNEKPGIGIALEKETVVELRYGLSIADWVGNIVSLIVCALWLALAFTALKPSATSASRP